MTTLFFDQYSEFIDNDNRNQRFEMQTTSEYQTNRCQAFLPPELIQGKRVLDLGCCVAAMGQWCLANGAAHYTGIDMQESYVTLANAMLSKYWPADKYEVLATDLIAFLAECEQYDVIICLGIYTYTDVFEFVKTLAQKCKDWVIIDGNTSAVPYQEDLPIIELVPEHRMNNEVDGTNLVGVAVRPMPAALKLVFGINGFECNGFVVPAPTEGSNCAYNDVLVVARRSAMRPTRFAMRFTRSQTQQALPLLRDALVDPQKNAVPFRTYSNATVIKPGSWKFDDEVAKRFKQEALNNIPDYVKVVQLTCDIFAAELNKDAAVLDVGSALGFTIGKMIDAGFVNAYGSEQSESMLLNSAHKDHIFLNSKVPTVFKKWDGVSINWTLHFIREREEYLREVFTKMSEGAILIVTDKMDFTEEQQQQYIAFKIERGMTEEEIAEKTAAIEGVLVTKPLEWYLSTLQQIGFKGIEVINSRFMFNTIRCYK